MNCFSRSRPIDGRTYPERCTVCIVEIDLSRTDVARTLVNLGRKSPPLTKANLPSVMVTKSWIDRWLRSCQKLVFSCRETILNKFPRSFPLPNEELKVRC